MVEIKNLTERANVALLRGVMQHWEDLVDLGDRRLLNWIAAGQVAGRTLVVGPTSKALRDLVVVNADEACFLVRGAADADEIARSAPEQRVWCGDISALAAEGEQFDTVICLADIESVVSLELEQRTWADAASALRQLVAPNGTLVLAHENDLGLHRVTGTHDPRVATGDGDWAPLSTWDRSRPRTVEQLKSFAPEGVLYTMWPDFEQVTGLVDVEASPASAEALAFHATTLTPIGPDPAYLVTASAAAGRLNDLAAGWLVIENPRVRPQALLGDPESATIHELSADLEGRSALSLFHDLALASDLPGIRDLIGAWSSFHAAGRFDPDLGLTLITADGDFVGLRPLDAPAEGRLAALARVATVTRDRAWVTPWPITDDAAAQLRQLNAMAQLEPISYDEAVRQLPPAATPLILDAQEREAVYEANQRELDAMRSKLYWVQLQLDAANQRASKGTPKSAIKKVTRGAGNTARRVLRELGLR